MASSVGFHEAQSLDGTHWQLPVAVPLVKLHGTVASGMRSGGSGGQPEDRPWGYAGLSVRQDADGPATIVIRVKIAGVTHSESS